ncbi:MAG: Rne/Rng family ribonuclease [Rhizobiaceae bacterium]
MPNKMLIDASHPEETRVVVVRGNRIEEFDFESQDKKQLKGNIYLARVTRVEPSLQAAFVEYGGNRHGFLAFSEIHPDYYQIPVADRQALLRAEAEEHEDEEDEESEERQERGGRGRRRRRGKGRQSEQSAQASDGGEAGEDSAENGEGPEVGELTPFEGAADEDAHEAADEAASAVEASADDAETSDADDAETGEAETGEEDADGKPSSIAASIDNPVISEPVPESSEEEAPAAESGAAADGAPVAEAPAADEDRGTVEEVPAAHNDDHEIESVGADDAVEEIRQHRKRAPRRNYKIQEVIKRRQILLVQVVKEERGNKGAALTTYLSLAGRYSVLMPNTARGGGISRKITNAQDRKRLKEVVADLEVPDGMGVILRTAGESRTKAEIKRDYEYLMRMWETVRNTTLQSTAPALVYEEGSLIKRSVRDLYNKDIDEILVSGDNGYREAKDFMRMLMPSHAKVVQPYRETVPIFARNGIEAQLDKMLQPQVTLKSGGYIIINQTEALVAIDVNSGRSTREHSIEDTALQTNLEAAEEVSRQLRLRDLAGLIVIDFIDMEENRNNRAVEKRLKDCLKNDRARIQVGRISHFGLMEMSRQRIRSSVLESTTKPCSHCGGTGHVRSDSSVALMVVRAIEEFLLKDSRHHITVRMPTATALYILNHKRSMLVELENRFVLKIMVEADESLGNQHYAIFRGAVADKPAGMPEHVLPPMPVEDDDIDPEIVDEDEAEEASAEAPKRQEQRGEEGEGNGRRRRRRRRRGGRDREHGDESRPGEAEAEAGSAEGDDEDGEDERGAAEPSAAEASEAAVGAEATNGDEQDGQQKKRRRGKRGGRRNRRDGESGDAAASGETGAADGDAEASDEQGASERVTIRQRGGRARDTSGDGEEAAAERLVEPVVAEEAEAVAAPAAEPAAEAEQAPEAAAEDGDDAAPARSNRRRAESSEPKEPVVSSVTSGEAAEPAPKKGGWWQRKGFF